MPMEQVLESFVASLDTELAWLRSNQDRLHDALHDPDRLPDLKISKLATTALDRLNELQLLLEPGHAILADHFLGYTNTKCLVAATELRIPDALRYGSQTLSSLAEHYNANPDRLGQILRTLTNNGIFSYNPTTKTYSNNHVSTLLLSDHWTQWHTWVSIYGNEVYDMARGIPASVRADSTRSPAQINYDTDDSMFELVVKRGWGAKFHNTFTAGTTAQAPGILEDYPWSEVADATIFDIGGGAGGLVAMLLGRHKSMKGAILDRAEVIEQAKANFYGPKAQYSSLQQQIPEENLVVGDFFEEVPSSEVYVMKWVLHDWDDEKATAILKNVRKAITRSERSRLVILESVLKDGRSGQISRYADLNMLVAIGGKERDEAAWRDLAKASGWELKKIYSLRKAWPSAIEFVPVWEEEKELTNGVRAEETETLTNGTHVDDADAPPAATEVEKQPEEEAQRKDSLTEEAPQDAVPSETTTESTTSVITPPESNEGDPTSVEAPKIEPAAEEPVSEQTASKAIEEQKTAETPTLREVVPEEQIPGQVRASMRFLEPWDSSRGTPYIRINPCPGYDRMNFAWSDHSVNIHNARPEIDDFDLDFHGFSYATDDISPELIATLRENKRDDVRKLYYPQIAELAKKITGGKRVIVFDHTLRKRRLELGERDNNDGKEQPATMVHCDQSPESAIRRLKENLHPWENIDDVLKHRVRMINIWRPLTEPVQDWPLATMDYHTTSPSSMHACNLLKETFEKRGQTATFTHDESQKWYYLDQQKTNEVTAIKIWDSADGVSKFCAHAAFKDPTAPADATPRESVEVRCLVLDEAESPWFRHCAGCCEAGCCK